VVTIKSEEQLNDKLLLETFGELEPSFCNKYGSSCATDKLKGMMNKARQQGIEIGRNKDDFEEGYEQGKQDIWEKLKFQIDDKKSVIAERNKIIEMLNNDKLSRQDILDQLRN